MARAFKPTLAGLIITGLVVFCFVPAVRLSQPGCHEYAAQSSHGDGAPAPKCLDGTRTLLAFAIPEFHFTNEFDAYRGWGWGLSVTPLIGSLLVGGIVAYIVVTFCFGMIRVRT